MAPITKLLIANRGEIAARIARSAREMDMATVAVFSDPDANAPHVTLADEAVHLAGSDPVDTYLRADRLIAAAARTGADAVHPGYGFLSESAGFARACADAGLTFVGPAPDAIEAMGSKIAAKELMARAGVPVLAAITVTAGDEPEPDDFAARVTETVGYPLLVKAVYGGGGRGMRIVHHQGELLDALDSARREAAAAFGDASVFVERYVNNPRHIEVQIIADDAGHVVALFERECSIQRRFQKIIEEAPSPAVDDELRHRLTQAAVSAARAIGYVGAGTVEFVLDETDSFAFLEVNTRLQVEHPVTEAITGLDLVRLQLLVAEGRPLPDEATAATIDGHAIEARLYAEDVGAGFLPATGTLARFAIPDLPGVRVDAGVADGSEVGVSYDPMLAKVIAHGRDRNDARRRLARALAEARIHGLVTNRDLLVGILREEEFAAGRTDTGYLARHDPAELARSGRHPDAHRLHALGAALAGQAERRHQAPVLASLPSGWRNVANRPPWTTYAIVGSGSDDGEASPLEVSYRVLGSRVEAAIDGVAIEGVTLHSASATTIDLEVEGVRRQLDVQRTGTATYVDSGLGSTTLREVGRFPTPGASVTPGSLLAPMPGTVTGVDVEVGATVAAGQRLVVMEAMKMEHSVVAPHDGVVAELGISVGQAVDVGTVLVVVEMTN